MRKQIFGIAMAAAMTVAALALTGCADSPDPSDPALTGFVSITGAPVVGQTLEADTGLLDGSGSLAFQWLRAGEAIAGATSSSYIVAEDDQGRSISVEVARSGRSGSVRSDPVGPVTIAHGTGPELTGTVAITGTPNVGQMLTANVAGLSGSGEVFFQWMRGGVAVPGANSAAYAVTAADAGLRIAVRATRHGHYGAVSNTPIALVPLTLSGQVWEMNWNDQSVHSSRNATLTGTHWGPPGGSPLGSGSIANGQMTFSVYPPDTQVLSCILAVFPFYVPSGKTTSSDPDARGAFLEMSNGDIVERMRASGTWQSGVLEWVHYVFVDRPVILSSPGWNYTYTGMGFTYSFTVNPFAIALREGWNTIHDRERITESATHWSGIVDISIANPGHMRWYWGGAWFDFGPGGPGGGGGAPPGGFSIERGSAPSARPALGRGSAFPFREHWRTAESALP